jgi:hypothetical protein
MKREIKSDQEGHILKRQKIKIYLLYRRINKPISSLKTRLKKTAHGSQLTATLNPPFIPLLERGAGGISNL